jgi:hypothetical protein
MDGAVSKLRFAAFHIIPYHARWRTNIDLKTFFVFPNTDERQKMRKMRRSRMRISKIQQGWRRKYHPKMKRVSNSQ